MRDHAGKLTHFVAHHTDITGQLIRGARLEHLNRRLELAARAGGIGVWEWDAVTQRCFWIAARWRCTECGRRSSPARATIGSIGSIRMKGSCRRHAHRRRDGPG